MTLEQRLALDRVIWRLTIAVGDAALSGLLTWGMAAFILRYTADRAEWLERVADGFRPWWLAA